MVYLNSIELLKEVFADPDRDESLIFELLDLKHEVGDGGSAVWFLQDIAREQDAEETMVSSFLMDFWDILILD